MLLAITFLFLSALTVAPATATEPKPEAEVESLSEQPFSARISMADAITLASLSTAAMPVVTPEPDPEPAATKQPGVYDDPYFPINYFNLKLGPQTFTAENDDSNSAFWSEAIFGYSLAPAFALEAGLGYLSGNGNGRIDFDYYGFPFLFGGRLFAPLGPVQLHAGANIAMYLLNVRAEDDATNTRERDSATLFGAGVSAGVNFDIGNGGFLGAEVKYTDTGETSIGTRDYDLDGVAVMFVSGIRF